MSCPGQESNWKNLSANQTIRRKSLSSGGGKCWFPGSVLGDGVSVKVTFNTGLVRKLKVVVALVQYKCDAHPYLKIQC